MADENAHTMYIPLGLAHADKPMEIQMASKSYVTAREITIPAGTLVHLAPNKISRFVPYAGVLLGVTNDSTAEWTMPLDEALENGIIKEIEK